MFQTTTSLENNRVGSHVVTCASYVSGKGARDQLIDAFGIDKVHTIYSSKSYDRTCFILHSSIIPSHILKSEGFRFVFNCLNDFIQINEFHIRFWRVLPNSIKVHESVMRSIFQLHDDESAPHTLENKKISVSGGVGISKNGFMNPISSEKFSSLIGKNPLEHIKKMSKEFSKQDDLWSEIARQTDSDVSFALDADKCLFPKLRYAYLSNGMEISNLHLMKNIPRAKECLASLVALFASHNDVVDIRMSSIKRAFNNGAKGVVQSGLRQTVYPYHDVGLNGSNQVIGIGDTGLDEYSCFFSNEDGSIVERSSYDNPTFDDSKRKVIQYINYADDSDTEAGHGTHVSGTVAGCNASLSDSDRYFNGHAPGSKIAFFDMELSASPEEGLSYPNPIGSGMLYPSYLAGARIHSDSWGGSYNMYDGDTVDIDAFHVAYDDFLMVIAAGNDGAEGYYSIGDPAVSKNALTVGASESGADDFDINNVAFFSSLGPTFDNRIKPDVVAPGFYTFSAYASGNGDATCQVISMAGIINNIFNKNQIIK